MPRGGARPGAGRKPKSLEELRLTGGFRPKRHKHLLQAVPPPSATSSAASVARGLPAIPKSVTAGLGAAGRQFVREVWAEFEKWSASDLRLLRQAAKVFDDFETATDARDRRLAARVFQGLVHQLGLVERK